MGDRLLTQAHSRELAFPAGSEAGQPPIASSREHNAIQATDMAEVAPHEPLLKVADVARALNVSQQMVYKLLQRGDIAAVRIGSSVRVRRVDLLAYIEHCRAPRVED